MEPYTNTQWYDDEQNDYQENIGPQAKRALDYVLSEMNRGISHETISLSEIL